MKNSSKHQGQSADRAEAAFTLVELMAVLVAVAMLGLLALPALAGNKSKSKAMQCLNNIRQIGMGTTLFTQENGYCPPLWRSRTATGWPTVPVYNATAFVVQNSGYLWWPDALRLEGYIKDPNIFSCPQLTSPPPRAIGGGVRNYSLGIGMNFPEIGKVISTSPGALPPKPSDVKIPSQTVVYGDSGAVTAASKDLNPDEWVSDTMLDALTGGITFFRSPSDPNFSLGDGRMLPRHDGRVVTGWADGRADIIKNSQIGWQYIRTDPRALWARSHNSLNPNLP